MENEQPVPERESLGALFRRLRLERSLDIEAVAEETRIPAKTIRAMESDYYDALPPHAFAQGFYSLYAKMLDLDHIEVLQRYNEERNGGTPARTANKVYPPSWQHKNIGTMAGKPTFTIGSLIGFGLILIILIGAGISWWAGFNPATHASRWLRNFQKHPVETSISDQDVLSREEVEITDQSVPVSATKYELVAEFPEATEIRVVIDEEEARTIYIPAGSTKIWKARTSILLDLPSSSTARLSLNGVVVPLPESSGDKIIVSIPESMFD